MKQTMTDYQPPSMFRDTVTGLVWQMAERDHAGAIYEDIKYKARLRLTDVTFRELVRMGRFTILLVESNIEHTCPAWSSRPQLSRTNQVIMRIQ
jgi:hypothetical protein